MSPLNQQDKWYQIMNVDELKYSEIFYSTQGEGLLLGTPSVFLRTFGCNFRCKNFGLKSNERLDRYNPEVRKLLDDGIIENTKKFEDLPLVHTGCDTYASIYPEFAKFAKVGNVDQVVENLLGLLPKKLWMFSNKRDVHLILTGGEPLLWQPFWIKLFEHKSMRSLRNVTFETNSTQALRPEFEDYLNNAEFKVTWSCSPKLSSSGEPRKKAIKPEVIKQYANISGSDIYLKFVMATTDVDELNGVIENLNNDGIRPPVYVMPTGGCVEEYQHNEPIIAKLALKNGWRFSPRLQLSLYGNKWGT